MNKIDTEFKNRCFVVDSNDITVFTSDASLDDCTIEFNASADNLIINSMKMQRGEFKANKMLANFQFCKAHFDQVSFTGSFSGCDFGQWAKKHGDTGLLSECDFSNVDLLHHCRFFNCDLRKEKLPRWPHVTIKTNDKSLEKIAAISWPGDIGLLMNIIANVPQECSFVVINTQALVDELGGTLDELRVCFAEQMDLNN